LSIGYEYDKYDTEYDISSLWKVNHIKMKR
jgi:hypothetical protein